MALTYKKAGVDISKIKQSQMAIGKLISSTHRLQKIAKIGRHTSELQSHSDLVCRLLLEKKKKTIKQKKNKTNTNYHSQQTNDEDEHN